jgi:hypothetical protein
MLQYFLRSWLKNNTAKIPSNTGQLAVVCQPVQLFYNNLEYFAETKQGIAFCHG